MAAEPAQSELRRWVDQIGACLWVTDGSWRCSFVSKGVEKLLGFPSERWLSEPFLPTRLPESEREKVLDEWRTLLAEGGSRTTTHRLLSADGREHFCRSELHADRERGELVGLTTDLTELERERRLSEPFVRSFDGVVWEAHAGSLQFSFVSAQAEQMFGYPLARWYEPDFWIDHLHPEDRASTLSSCLIATRAGLPHRLEYRLMTADGRALWIQDLVSPSFEDGKPKTVHGLMVDISARKRAEEERDRSLSLARAALESTADGLLVVDLHWRIVGYNRKFAELWRIPQELLASGDDLMLLDAVSHQVDDQGAFVHHVQQLYRDLGSESFDVLRLRDGRVFERYSQPQRIGGRTVGRVWSFRDVTERRRAEAERERLLVLEREKQQRMALLADAGRVLARTIDYESTVAAVLSLAVPRLADWALLELLPHGGRRRVAALHADPERDELLHELERLPPTEHVGHEEALRRREPMIQWNVPQEGLSSWGPHSEAFLRLVRQLQPQSSLAVPLVVGERLLGTLTLVSGEERHYGPGDAALVEELAARCAMTLENAWLYQQAQHAVQLRDEFLTVASHELRTPCTALLLGVQGLERQMDRGSLAQQSPEALRRKLAVAERQTRQLVSLIDDLLDVSRLSAGRLHLEAAPVDLAQLTRELVADFGEALARSGSRVQLRADRPIEGQWDRGRLEQVVTNLLSNAIKYGAGSLIEIAVEDMGGLARLAVTDHGIGIPHEQQAQVFERFARAVSARHYGGLGLGLYLVRQIVAAFGGTIRLWSEPGVGTTFTLELPRRRLSAAPPREEREAAEQAAHH